MRDVVLSLGSVCKLNCPTLYTLEDTEHPHTNIQCTSEAVRSKGKLGALRFRQLSHHLLIVTCNQSHHSPTFNASFSKIRLVRTENMYVSVCTYTHTYICFKCLWTTFEKNDKMPRDEGNLLHIPEDKNHIGCVLRPQCNTNRNENWR